MTQAAKTQEPSMEEILASIRRIIADDDATKTPPKAPEPAAANTSVRFAARAAQTAGASSSFTCGRIRFCS